MKLGFEESQLPYTSGSQSARAWTEAWVKAWAYCPHCGSTKMSQFPNNSPVADFLCASCSEEFELKSQKAKFGAKLADLQDKVRAPCREQQSQPAADEL
jgi:type II restriction enzyme